MLDLIKNFAQYQKTIKDYWRSRVFDTYFKSQCATSLRNRVSKMDSCWDLIPSTGSASVGQRFLQETYYPLVKAQIKLRRAISSNAFRYEPFFTYSSYGNTPTENAQNITQLVDSNNKNTKYRQTILLPSINYASRYGTAVIYTEYQEMVESGYQTIYDPMIGVSRKYGPLNISKSAKSYVIDPRHYFQNPNIIDSDESDYRGMIKRIPLSKIIEYYKTNPELFIKENIEKVLQKMKKSSIKEPEYVDPMGRQSKNDYNNVITQDLCIGQCQFHFEDNEDDQTYYTVWSIGEEIIRFQDNPYDRNMNQFTIITMEPRFDTWHGNSPAEDSVGNENAVNLINGIGLENLLASMNRYIFFNKNAFKDGFGNRPLNFLNPVDVSPTIALNNIMWQYQAPDISGSSNELMYSRIMQNDQRLAAASDVTNPQESGGMTNKTATAANMLQQRSDISNADIIEMMSMAYAKLGTKQELIIQQFIGNDGGVRIRPRANQQEKLLQKNEFLGNYYCYTNVQKTYYGRMQELQNTITWLINMIPSVPALQQANMAKLISETLKTVNDLNVDDIIPPELVQQIPGYQQSQVQPGQEQAGVAQENGGTDMQEQMEPAEMALAA